MHLACALKTPAVALFGCSDPRATGPWVKDLQKAKFFLIASERMTGCKDKPCYKNRCKKCTDASGPMNEILAQHVFQACEKLLKENENVAA